MLGVIIFLIILAIALMLGVVITVKKHAYKMLIAIPFVGTLVIVIMMIILGTMRQPKEMQDMENVFVIDPVQNNKYNL